MQIKSEHEDDGRRGANVAEDARLERKASAAERGTTTLLNTALNALSRRVNNTHNLHSALS